MKRANLFLLELVLDLLLFALCAAVCVGLLLHAKGMSLESRRLTDAVYLAQDAAETWRTGGTPAETSDGYEIQVTETGDKAPLRCCDITISRDGEIVYTLEGVTAP